MTIKPKCSHSDHIENLSDKEIDKLFQEIDIQFKTIVETMNFDEMLEVLRESADLPKSAKPAADHQDEIAEACGCTQQAVDKILQQTAELPKVVKPAADHLIDFDIDDYLETFDLDKMLSEI